MRAIVDGPDSQASNAIACAVQAITAFLPQDVSPAVEAGWGLTWLDAH